MKVKEKFSVEDVGELLRNSFGIAREVLGGDPVGVAGRTSRSIFGEAP